jgi:energy-converting hydrogenase A subunit M
MQHSYNQSRLGKLKKSDWIIIKYLYENDIFQKELANYFNISASSIKEILVKMNVRIKTQTEIRHLQYHTPNRKTVESLLADLEVKE